MSNQSNPVRVRVTLTEADFQLLRRGGSFEIEQNGVSVYVQAEDAAQTNVPAGALGRFFHVVGMEIKPANEPAGPTPEHLSRTAIGPHGSGVPTGVHRTPRS